LIPCGERRVQSGPFLVSRTGDAGENFENNTSEIKIILNYKGWWIKKPLFSTLKRVSKPGHRVFSGYKTFDNIIDVLRYEQGIAIISTSIGVMSHNKATKLKKGGEVLCYVG